MVRPLVAMILDAISNWCGLYGYDIITCTWCGLSGYDIGLLNPAGCNEVACKATKLGCEILREIWSSLEGKRPERKDDVVKWKHFALVCCVGRKWFQRGTIDHFLMKYSHAKCGVTGDEPRNGEKEPAIP
ncbi:hypothetical protein L2E82_28518 [Cichorium intybus]|uniref:Uncharacterized protein n=1 Tax=Cichorium intybus TaxID=13427 RepID=A0ACB9CW95_CICIN|nr:hypothetical protein L2E82_28518 [Cichorium intybus]